MKHLHHIIPKHAGGSDDPSNLIELTVKEHAEAHKKLFDDYGRIQDKLAWLGLEGILSREEIVKELLKRPKSEEWKAKNRKPKKDNTKYFGHKNAISLKGKPKSDLHKKKIAEAHKGMVKGWLVGNTHAAGNKGKKKTEEHQQSIIDALNSPEVKEKISKTWNDKPIVKCPHCGVEGKEGHNMNRYHFKNCKVIQYGKYS
jgi:hypothetical protein